MNSWPKGLIKTLWGIAQNTLGAERGRGAPWRNLVKGMERLGRAPVGRPSGVTAALAPASVSRERPLATKECNWVPVLLSLGGGAGHAAGGLRRLKPPVCLKDMPVCSTILWRALLSGRISHWGGSWRVGSGTTPMNIPNGENGALVTKQRQNARKKRTNQGRGGSLAVPADGLAAVNRKQLPPWSFSNKFIWPGSVGFAQQPEFCCKWQNRRM